MIKSKKIQASAIYYALFLSVIFALILGGFILLSGFNQKFALQMDVEEILIDNSHSGMAYAQVYFKELENNAPTTIRLFDEGVDSVELVKKNWGAFTILSSKASHRNSTQSKIALFGAALSSKQTNLYLVDNGRPISLCGDARIEGLCFLPKAGLKRAYINGQNYTGGKLVYGTVKTANKQLPSLQSNFLEELIQVNGELTEWNEDEDSIIVSFGGNAAHFLSDRYITIQNTVIKGQVIVEARDSIFVGRNAIIENAVLKSKVIYIEAGFSGTAQIFASERIIIEEDVSLKYPSVLCLIEEQFSTEKSAEIYIGEGSQVIGTVFMFSKTPNFRKPPMLTIESEGEIDGLVYCAGKTQLKGIINGSLFTEKLFLKTGSSAYENHLLNGKILDQLPKDFVTANLFETTEVLQQIAWLE
ncbi:MAG: hypothetical protein GQ574_22890 [Crocinitomix sp.]|nr:hypothetical protein [Crocinitomix sp.]